MPYQRLGAHWHLDGSLKSPETGIPPFSRNYLSQGNGELVLDRRVDAFSPHISSAKTNQLVIPKLTVTAPSGLQVNLHNAHVKEQTSTNELEQVSFTFQKIEIEPVNNNKTGTDSWLTGTG